MQRDTYNISGDILYQPIVSFDEVVAGHQHRARQRIMLNSCPHHVRSDEGYLSMTKGAIKIVPVLAIDQTGNGIFYSRR